MGWQPHQQIALLHSVIRLEACCVRGEDEFPKLAAPDGTVAVNIDDLRRLLDAYAPRLKAQDKIVHHGGVRKP